jgi:hypothetical protein
LPFLALSYVWGDLTRTKQIKLNGQLFDVGENLHDALRYVSREQSALQGLIKAPTRGGLLLWADAICLDQTNEQEKAQQIPRMGTIFSYAEHVFIWFGNMEQISEAKIQLFAETVNCEVEDSSLACLRERLGDRFVDFMETFRLILEHEWFSRVWTTQEYVRSKQSPLGVVLGKLLIMSGLLTAFADSKELSISGELNDVEAEAYFNLLKGAVRIIILDFAADRIRSASYLNMPLAKQLLHNFDSLVNKHATPPYDHIYGLLGMLTVSELPQNLMPDYTLPFQQVFHSYIRYVIENTGSLSILECNGDALSDLPS